MSIRVFHDKQIWQSWQKYSAIFFRIIVIYILNVKVV